MLAVLEGRANGQINDATADFAAEFQFKDYGTGLEFHDKKSLAEFFGRTREFYQDSSVQANSILVTGARVSGDLTFQATLSEPPYGGLTRKLPLSLHGVSISRVENGKITDWADYHNGLTSRRTAFASYLREWQFYSRRIGGITAAGPAD